MYEFKRDERNTAFVYASGQTTGLRDVEGWVSPTDGAPIFSMTTVDDIRVIVSDEENLQAIVREAKFALRAARAKRVRDEKVRRKQHDA